MKLHSIIAGTTEDVTRLHELGKALVSPQPALDEAVLDEAKLKPIKGEFSRDPGMEDAILAITQDQPLLHKKIKHHD